MIDYHRIVTEYEGRVSEDDCGSRCVGAHRCCQPGQAHPLMPGEGAFLSDHGFKVGYNSKFGVDVYICQDKKTCPGVFRPVVCRTYPLHPGPKGLRVDTQCSEYKWLSHRFVLQMEKMWRYIVSTGADAGLWITKFEEAVWSNIPEIPLYKVERDFDQEYTIRFRRHFNIKVIKDIMNIGWVQSGDHLLDVGGGAGERHQIYREYGVTPTTLDVNPSLASVCDGIKADVRSIPLDDNSFDIVLCFDVLEHLDDATQAIREMLRVSKDRVAIYITTLENIDNLLKDPTHRIMLPFSSWLRKFDALAEILDVDYSHTGALLKKKEIKSKEKEGV